MARVILAFHGWLSLESTKTSPLSFVQDARYAFVTISCDTNRTAPSARQKFDPPGWLLRKLITLGQFLGVGGRGR